MGRTSERHETSMTDPTTQRVRRAWSPPGKPGAPDWTPAERNPERGLPAKAGARVEGSSRPWLDRWMALLRTIGNIQAWIILTVFYVVIVTPFGFFFRLFADPLRLRRTGASNWQPFAHSYERLEHAREQS